MQKINKSNLGLNCLTTGPWLKLLILTSSLALAACQSTPPTKIVTNKTAAVANGIGYKPLLIQQGIAGLTDINWDIISLNSKNPQTFVNKPYLFLQGANQRVAGSTGCNVLRGGYETQATNNIKFQASAGHMSCDNALAQEADIIDALSRTVSYRLQQNMLYLYDQQGGLLLTAKRR